MDELQEIRKRRLMEFQEQGASQENQQLESQLEQLETAVKQFLSKEALQRYGNIKAAHKDKAVQMLVILGQAIQQGKIREKISDKDLKDLLKKLQPEKKEFKIRHV